MYSTPGPPDESRSMRTRTLPALLALFGVPGQQGGLPAALGGRLGEAPRVLETRPPADTRRAVARAAGDNDADGAAPEWLPTTTTLMIRNISLAMSKDSVIGELETRGFRGKFDFISVPRRTGRVNLGYAFINFCSPNWAKLCHQRCHGQPFGATGGCMRNCEVLPAHRQRHAGAQNSSQNSQAGRSGDSADAAYGAPGQASRHSPGTVSAKSVQPELEEAGRHPSGHGTASDHGYAGAQSSSQSNGCPAGRSGSSTDTAYEASPYLTSRQSPGSATLRSSLQEIFDNMNGDDRATTGDNTSRAAAGAAGRHPSAHGTMSFRGAQALWTTTLAPSPPSRSGASSGLPGLAGEFPVAQVAGPFFI